MQDFSGPFPVEVITRMAGVPEEYRQQVRHWIDTALHSRAGQIELSEAGMQANIDSAMYYYGLVQERRAEPAGRHDQQADRRRDRRRGRRQLRKLDDIEITGFTSLLGGAGAETVTKLVGSAVVTFAQNPDQWQMLLDDRSKIPAAVEETAALRRPGAVQRALQRQGRHSCTAARFPAGKPGVPDGRGRQPRSPRLRPTPTRFDIDRDRTEAQNLGLGYGIHSCLGAALARMESAIALERLLDFMPRYEVDFDGLQARPHAERRRLPPRPVKVLR